jgi:hypothetical protein
MIDEPKEQSRCTRSLSRPDVKAIDVTFFLKKTSVDITLMIRGGIDNLYVTVALKAPQDPFR